MLLTPKMQDPPNTKKNCMSFGNIKDLIMVYNKADILYISNDTLERELVSKHFSKHLIKTNEKDTGRKLNINIIKSSNELFKEIIKEGNSYALIVINQKLGPDSYSGCECIQYLRKCGYKGAIVLVIDEYPKKIYKYEKCGSNAVLVRKDNIITKEYFDNIKKFLSQLTIRNLDLL